MGILIASAIWVTYFVGQRFAEPIVVVAVIVVLTSFLLVISYVITRAFEKVVEAREREAKRAKELLKLKDEFVFIAAHELRVPANITKWAIETLEAQKPEFIQKEKKVFDLISKSNERLLLLVQDLLESARLEGETIKIKTKSVSLSYAFNEAVASLEKTINDAGVSIHNNIPPDLPFVLADEIRLKEIFTNLLSNAINYRKDGGGGISVVAKKANHHVEVHVTDNGIGISKEDQKHIFKKFWRSSQVQEISGTGLGLFIVKQLVERMSGRIWFTSQPGKGSTFSFSLKMSNKDLLADT